jgi:hypothetical protein
MQDDPFTTLRRVIGRRLGELKQKRKLTNAANEQRSLEIRSNEVHLIWDRFLMTGAFRKRDPGEEEE